MSKMLKLSAALQGLLIVAGLGAAATAYMKWPQIKGWWIAKDNKLDDDGIEKLKKRKEKKRALEFPTISENELPSSVPGLYYWGAGRKDGKTGKFPLRVPFFDNMILRDVALSTSVANLAIDDKGDLLAWDTNSARVLLADQNLIQVKVSNGTAYALNKKGEILVIPLNDEAKLQKNLKLKRSWIFPWKQYSHFSLKLNTKDAFRGRSEKKVAQFDVGKDHLLFISDAGKAYVCATGVVPVKSAKSKGQFGVPSLSQFDEFPEQNKVYEVELLNHSIGEGKVTDRKIKKVACGNYHSVVLDSLGDVYSFGLNTYGQLGQAISYDMEIVPFPKKVEKFNAHFARDTYLKCIDIHCGGNTSFVSVLPQNIHKLLRNSGKTSFSDEAENICYFSFGCGLHGELGNGHFKHSQQEPTKLKVVNEVSSSSNGSNSVHSKIMEWYCGGEHTFCKLENGEVVAWGSNDEGQLGNGKKIKSCKPMNIPKLLEPGVKLNSDPEQPLDSKNSLHLSAGQSIAAGENSSCIYWKSV